MQTETINTREYPLAFVLNSPFNELYGIDSSEIKEYSKKILEGINYQHASDTSKCPEGFPQETWNTFSEEKKREIIEGGDPKDSPEGKELTDLIQVEIGNKKTH